ncbi:MAG TPA: hypothetical protein VM165_19560 [Planctomycetaceae bacterium]|nr:hypothetical protein [Planctomycetaceae bacterium]
MAFADVYPTATARFYFRIQQFAVIPKSLVLHECPEVCMPVRLAGIPAVQRQLGPFRA